jgi:hypothetical protein
LLFFVKKPLSLNEYFIFVAFLKGDIDMKLFKLLLGVLLISGLTAVAHPSAKAKKKDKAQVAYNAGDYAKALALWQKTIAKYESRNRQKKCRVYTHAGIAAYHLKQWDVARNLLEKARYTASENAQTFYYLAKVYRQIDNLSLEIDALENYLKKYPGDVYVNAARKRLLATYVESENWELITKLWKQIPAACHDSIFYRDAYLAALGGLQHTHQADSLSALILKNHPSNKTALEWKAEKYYQLGENLYQSEMAAYKKHHTNAQYAHLLKAFEKVTVYFKRSLSYYRKLYRMKPTSFYAKRLGTIYMRLDNKPKGKYYIRMAKQLK